MLNRLRAMVLLPLMALAACAAIGAASNIATAISQVAAVAGRPASTVQTAAVVSTKGSVGDAVVMRGTQGLIVANNAYQSAAAIAEAYVRAGRATPDQLTRIRALNDRAISLLEYGGTGLSVAQRAAEVLNIVAELNLFKGGK